MADCGMMTELVVPKNRVEEILEECHDSKTAGHWGVQKTLDLMERSYKIKDLRKTVEKYVTTCPICQAVKAERKKKLGVIEPLRIPERRWQAVHMDWVLGLPPWPPGEGTYDAVLTFTDRATKQVHLVPTNRFEQATDTARYFLNYVVRVHGLPRSLICDRDSRFQSKFWRTLMDMLGVAARHTSGFHPQANGQAERTNQNLRQYLRVASKSNNGNWVADIPLCEMAINNASIGKTELTPYLLNLGYHPYLIPDSLWYYRRSDLREANAQNWSTGGGKSGRATRKHCRTSRKKMPHMPTATGRRHEFKPGDLVMVRMFPVNRNQLNPKGPFADRWAGPYQVVGQISHQSYRLKLPISDRSRFGRVFHAQQLKKYHARPGVPTPEPPPMTEAELAEINDQLLEDDLPEPAEDPPQYPWGEPVMNVPAGPVSVEPTRHEEMAPMDPPPVRGKRGALKTAPRPLTVPVSQHRGLSRSHQPDEADESSEPRVNADPAPEDDRREDTNPPAAATSTAPEQDFDEPGASQRTFTQRERMLEERAQKRMAEGLLRRKQRPKPGEKELLSMTVQPAAQ